MSVRNSHGDGIEMAGVGGEKKYELEAVKSLNTAKKVRKPLGKDEELVGHEWRDMGNG